MSLNVRWLGRVGFEEALALQEEIVARRTARESEEDVLLLLEHLPVYTVGRTPGDGGLPGEGTLPHPLIRTNRGGQATYHGPGQLVGYPILDLRRHGQDLHRYLRSLESVIISYLEGLGIQGVRREGLTGVWVGGRKIASIGVGVRRWITMHGFALNVCGDLAPFRQIVPCGIAGVEMTNMEREAGIAPTVEAAGSQIAAIFEKEFFAAI